MKLLISRACIFLFLLITFSLKAQDLPYYFSTEIRDTSFIENNKIFHGYPIELLYSYKGDYQSAMRALLKGNLSHNTSAISGLTDAKEYILGHINNSRIVIINEAHHIPSGRVFSASLLHGLADMGFTYFAVEGMPRKNDSLNIRKTPELNDVYYYEPQYGNMLREALRSGFHVLGYDTADNSVRSDEALFAARRDSLSAVRIKKLLDTDPSAKIFIHCGYSHGYECTTPIAGKDIKRFAMILHEITGIDPFTINQEKYNEVLPGTYGLGFSTSQQVNTVSAIRFSNEKYETSFADVTICHPLTQLLYNRPDWLKTEKREYYLPALLLSANDSMIVLAYPANEIPERAIPVDVIEISGKNDRSALVLEPGNYNLLFIDKRRNKKIIPVTVGGKNL